MAYRKHETRNRSTLSTLVAWLGLGMVAGSLGSVACDAEPGSVATRPHREAAPVECAADRPRLDDEVIAAPHAAVSVASPPSALLPAGAAIDRLVVYKHAARMEAYEGTTLVKTYDVGTGAGGAGTKRWEGDMRTPEGEYRIDARHVSKRFHRFLHVSYPNASDRRRFRRLKAAGKVPAGRGIGSAIGLHGPPTGVGAVFGDWTAGCIAVTEAEAKDLYRRVVRGARITIHP